MPKFEVILSFTQTSRAVHVLEADSKEEAEYLAEELEAADIENWNPIDGEVHVESVNPVTKKPKRNKYDKTRTSRSKT